MSHFTVLVIGDNPEKQLAPFDENIRMDKYVKHTKEQLIENGKKDIEDYKNRTYAEYLANPEKYAENCSNPAHLKYVSEDFPKKLDWTDEEIYAYQIEYEEEEDITPDGGIYSTYNPLSKWDWYQLGGRWAGCLTIAQDAPYNKPNFSWGWQPKDMQDVIDARRADSALKKHITNLNEISTYAVLKDGEWMEKGEMGWFGMSNDKIPQEEWDAKITELLNSLPDDTLISIYDCHI